MSTPLPVDAAVTSGRPGDLAPLARAPLLILGFAALFVGAGAGLARLGWGVPAAIAATAALHGPLMICGFFGVVIALERAVAIGRYWAYLAPALTGAGGAAAVAGSTLAAAWLLVAGALLLLAASIDILRRQTALFTFTLTLGSACWAIGNVLWVTGSSVHHVVPWWLAFLVLTIAAERLELSRFLMPSPVAKWSFAAIIAVIGVGLVVETSPWGTKAFAAGLVALAAWLARQDIARRTVRKEGLTRFIAVCLLSGYVWLALAGGIVLVFGLSPGARSYDAALHALGLGFVFSMVFGHAPIILPAVLRIRVPYHATFYVPLTLLHLSLLVRLVGDGTAQFAWTRTGGLLNALALLAFIASTVRAAVHGREPALKEP
jgi:hypothetical protein